MTLGKQETFFRSSSLAQGARIEHEYGKAEETEMVKRNEDKEERNKDKEAEKDRKVKRNEEKAVMVNWNRNRKKKGWSSQPHYSLSSNDGKPT